MKLYNSLTRSKEIFIPIKDNEVKMYVCGITPYDTTHLGHAFTYTAFDLLYRFLTYQKFKVKYTQNVTDIDDDLLKRAKRDNENWKELGKRWTNKFVGDMKILNNTPPTHFVKATETMDTIIEIITKLIGDGVAYEKEGNVYFSIQKDTQYGKLSGFTHKEMMDLSRERGANPDDPLKKEPLDFILWQKSLPDEPFWEAPWSKGRPGWHIECSAMVYKYLGNSIDIHGGGIDLIYPHHESEIAQSEQFTGKKPFSQFWMHTGAVMFESEKMSKSLGNLIMISELFKDNSPNSIRALLLSHHYRKSWEYFSKDLDKSKFLIREVERIVKEEPTQKGTYPTEILSQFTQALEDDLDSPKALSVFYGLADTQAKNPTYANQETLLLMGDVLGFYL